MTMSPYHRTQLKRFAFAKFAKSVAPLTTCKRKQVGCVIYNSDFTRVEAIGYNGQPATMPNDGCTGESKNCGCIHAEINALMKLRTDDDDLEMIVTLAPCNNCARMIVNDQRITAVWFLNVHSDMTGQETLLDANIGCGQLILPEDQ